MPGSLTGGCITRKPTVLWVALGKFPTPSTKQRDPPRHLLTAVTARSKTPGSGNFLVSWVSPLPCCGGETISQEALFVKTEEPSALKEK